MTYVLLQSRAQYLAFSPLCTTATHGRPVLLDNFTYLLLNAVQLRQSVAFALERNSRADERVWPAELLRESLVAASLAALGSYRAPTALQPPRQLAKDRETAAVY